MIIKKNYYEYIGEEILEQTKLKKHVESKYI